MVTITKGGRWILIVIGISLLMLTGCEINDFTSDPNAEYRESFLLTQTVGSRNELLLGNVNGSVTVIGVDTLTDVRISGTKIVKDQTVDEAHRHIGDIQITVSEDASVLTVKTVQPNTTSGRTYQVDYQILIPRKWKVTVANVNGNVEIGGIQNTVLATTVNGTVTTSEISGNLNVSVTNGSVNGKVYLPTEGSATVSLVNGNISLLVPRTSSASVSATVVTGTVSVSNLAMTYSTNSRTSVSGVAGGGKGMIKLSAVNGIIQLIGF